MRDHGPSIGPLHPSASKRAGHALASARRTGAVKAAPGASRKAAHGEAAPPARVVVPISDFEGFGSFSG